MIERDFEITVDDYNLHFFPEMTETDVLAMLKRFYEWAKERGVVEYQQDLIRQLAVKRGGK